MPRPPSSPSPKTILITGASSGLGRSIARHLADQGHRVFGTSRHPTGDVERVRMLPLDVTDDASAARCVEAVLAEAGTLDVLVNNAGSGICGAIADTTPAEAREQMDVNFWGPVRMTRLVLPHLLRQRSGRIVTIGSMAGHAALPFQPYYSASKFALEGYNEALRLELCGTGVDATIVCPGDFKTGFTAARRLVANARSVDFGDRLARTLAIYERDENAGADPQNVARLLARLVDARSVDVRYFVGKAEQRVGMVLKRWLPARRFEAIMRATYRISA